MTNMGESFIKVDAIDKEYFLKIQCNESSENYISITAIDGSHVWYGKGNNRLSVAISVPLIIFFKCFENTIYVNPYLFRFDFLAMENEARRSM